MTTLKSRREPQRRRLVVVGKVAFAAETGVLGMLSLLPVGFVFQAAGFENIDGSAGGPVSADAQWLLIGLVAAGLLAAWVAYGWELASGSGRASLRWLIGAGNIALAGYGLFLVVSDSGADRLLGAGLAACGCLVLALIPDGSTVFRLSPDSRQPIAEDPS